MISAIDGTAGVGKTALAVYWAHQVAGHYPDGQLYVNLRGFDPAAPPMDPAEAICGFLDAYEIPAARIPAAPEAQGGLYRSFMVGKRALIVLDNARDAAQVRPLLPGSPSCLTIVTSRNQLTGLAVAYGAQPITVDLFTSGEAHDFLARRLGHERIEEAPGAAAELIDLCARLPLAISIVAARALRQPALPLATLASQLRDSASRLDELDSGDAATGVRPVLSWSYQNLNPEAARMLRLLSVHPGPDVSVPAAASLAGVPLAQARGALAELTHANMLNEHVPARFTFHDLLRAYAAEQAHATDTDTVRRRATHRMLDHYAHTAHAAAGLLKPGRKRLDLDCPQPGVVPELLAGYGGARRWFGVEHRVLLAGLAQAADEGFDAHAWQISWALQAFLDMLGRWRDQITTQEIALAASRRQGDFTGQIWAHRFLGLANIQMAFYDEAAVQLRKAVQLSEQRHDEKGLAGIYMDLTWMLNRQGRYREALAHVQQALDFFSGAGDRSGQARSLNSAAWCHAHLGNVQEAVALGEQALALHRELSEPQAKADVLDTLGYALYRDGRFNRAVGHFRHAVDLFRELGDRYYEADSLKHLGDACQAAGDLPSARDCWQRALAMLEELEHPDAEELPSRLRGVL